MPDELVRRRTIAKPGGGWRTITELEPRLAARYERAVAEHLPWIEATLQAGVIANRARPRAAGIRLDDWRAARRRYRLAIATAAAGPGRTAFIGDVRDCFGSIAPDLVVAAIGRLGAPTGIRRLAAVLDELQAAGVRGLPVGPPPSAVLANAVLAAVDRTVRAAAGTDPIRWVDDVVVPVADPRAAQVVRQAFDDALGAIGLAPALDKCREVTTGELMAVLGTASLAFGARRGMMRAP